MWGFANVRKTRNEIMVRSEDAGSAKYERRAAKEQRRFLEELQKKMTNEDEDVQNTFINCNLEIN